MRHAGRDDSGRAGEDSVARASAAQLSDAAPRLLDRAVGFGWYERPGNDVDLAAYTLCRLRRARAGERGGPAHGDEAVRAALVQATPEALVWLASRAISYMDETGFPELVEPWLAETRVD